MTLNITPRPWKNFGYKSLAVSSIVLTLAFAVLFGSSALFAGAAQEKFQNKKVVLTKNKTLRQPVAARKSAEMFDHLIEAARTNGSARIIVGLTVNFAPEDSLTADDASRQRADIRQEQNDLLNRLASFKVADVKQFNFIPFMALEADAEAIEFLKRSARVNFIQEDKPFAASLAQSVPLVGATNAWNAGYTGSGQTIAVLDTGVDKNHPFLANKVVSEACYSTSANNAFSFCPGGASSSTEVDAGLDCVGADGCQHGTHVAGIAAGLGAAGEASGVAKDANIIAVQVFTRFNDAANCDGGPMPCARYLPSDVIRGLERIYELRNDYKIAAVNLSLGGNRYYSTCDTEEAATKTAIDNLRAAKIATVVASGNDSWTDSMDAPACISSAISVGSTRDENLTSGNADAVSNFSNSAPFLSILAPGEMITSSIPGGGYANYPGTSMASPHVAGAFAILKNHAPNATVTQIFDALNSTGIAVTDARNNITKKRIKIDAAINALPGGDKIVFINGRDGDAEIYTMNADGTNRRRITNNTEEERYPTFSPDGRKILYTIGSDSIYTINADGTNKTLILPTVYSINSLSFSPDGSKIVYNDGYDNNRICTVNADGSNRVCLTDGATSISITPSWSPDGRKIVYAGTQGNAYRVMTVNADGTGMTVMTGSSYSVTFPKFSPDGRKIIFDVFSGTFQGINTINNFALSETTQLTPGTRSRKPGYSSDGSKIVFEKDSSSFIPSIHVMNADGSGQRLIGFANDHSPNWYLPAAQNAFSAATTVGQNIVIADGGNFALSFGNVTAAGNTVVTNLAANQIQPLPNGYTLPANTPKYEIATAAGYTDNIAVTLRMPGVPNSAACGQLKILHYTNGAWDAANNLPPSYDAETQICTVRQVVTSLSPFVVAQEGAPTAASVTVSGRVMTAAGKGIPGAWVTFTTSDGEQRSVRSGAFGRFQFTEVPAGETYVFSVSARRYTFRNPTEVRSITEDTDGVNFIAED